MSYPQPSDNVSVASTITANTMGGTPGEGMMQQQTHQPQMPTQQSGYPPNTPMGGGSITRFATPELSYAQRSAQAFNSYGAPQQQQPGYPAQQQQQYNPNPPSQYPPQQQQQLGYSYQTPPVAPSTVGGGYAARSAQAHAATGSMAPQQQQPNMTMNSSSYSPQTYATPQPSVVGYRDAGSVAPSVTPSALTAQTGFTQPAGVPVAMQQQQRLLMDATKKVQEHTYYMKQAMEQKNLPVALDRAAHLVGELGTIPTQQPAQGPTNSGAGPKLSPKNYYELYMRVVENLPTLQDYWLQVCGGNSDRPLPEGHVQIVMDPNAPAKKKMTMYEIYDAVHYTPRVLSRLYLQITAAASLLQHSNGEESLTWVWRDLLDAVKCEQNPIRGLFLRYYLLQALRDSLPDKETDEGKGCVKDAYEFVLENFMEMNKLWVRIQHLPGEGGKNVRKRRERERNDLRTLVGTNLIRLSQLEQVTSKVYGEVILNQILDHIVTSGDPLSQAYLMDCLVQAFPDEYHIETLPVLLNVCPRLKDKVNIRTILQGLMERLSHYLNDGELSVDESDTNNVKKQLAMDAFGMFSDCVQSVYNARGPKLTSKEVIRLQTALIQFSVKCYPDDTTQIGTCLSGCVEALKQANASYNVTEGTVVSDLPPASLDEVSVAELEKLLSIPLEKWALECLKIDQYGDLLAFLPWTNRKHVGLTLLSSSAKGPESVTELEELLRVLEPLLRDETPPALNQMMGGMSMTSSIATPAPLMDPGYYQSVSKDNESICKLATLVTSHISVDTAFQMLQALRQHVQRGESQRISITMAGLAVNGLKLTKRIAYPGITPIDDIKADESTETKPEEAQEEVKDQDTKGETQEIDAENAADVEADKEEPTLGNGDSTSEKSVTNTRPVFLFVQECISQFAKTNPEVAIKLYLDAAALADHLQAEKSDTEELSGVVLEMMTQAFSVYDECLENIQSRRVCVELMIAALMQVETLDTGEFGAFVTRATQNAAKSKKKRDQCHLVSLCAYLFFPSCEGKRVAYSEPQRAVECLQRALKLADACATADESDVQLFVDLLEHYLYFFEHKVPSITHPYVSGLLALAKEHIGKRETTGNLIVLQAKAHYLSLVEYVKGKVEVDSHFSEVKVAG